MRVSIFASLSSLAILSAASLFVTKPNVDENLKTTRNVSRSARLLVVNQDSDKSDDPFGNSDSNIDPFESGKRRASPPAKQTTKSAVKPDHEKLPASATAKKNLEDILEVSISWDYNETPFGELLDDWREKFKINIILDQSAMDDSLTQDEIITFSAKKISFRQALTLMLKSKNATFCTQNGVLLLISKDVGNDPEYLERTIINVRSLLTLIKASEPEHMNAQSSLQGIQIFLARPRQQGGFGGGGGVFNFPQGLGGGEKGGLGSVNLTDEQAKVVQKIQKGGANELVLKGNFVVNPKIHSPSQRLVDLLQTTIAPNSWVDTNGDGTIDIVGGMLVLTQTNQNIHETREFLKELEYFLSKE